MMTSSSPKPGHRSQNCHCRNESASGNWFIENQPAQKDCDDHVAIDVIEDIVAKTWLEVTKAAEFLVGH